MATARLALLHNPSISWSPDVLRQIRSLAVEGLLALPQRGIEVGGLLLGSVSERTPYKYTIRSVAPISCEHQSGPGFYLSAADRLKLAQQLARIRAVGEECVVGYFRSRTAPGAQPELDSADRELIDEFFTEPSHLFLSVRPWSVRRCEGAVFHYSGEEIVPAGGKFDIGERPAERLVSSTSAPVVVRQVETPPGEAAPVETQYAVPVTPVQAMPVQSPPVQSAPAQATPVPAAPPAPRTPEPEQIKMPHPGEAPMSEPGFYAEKPRKSRRFWQIVALTFALLAMFLLYQRQGVNSVVAKPPAQSPQPPVNVKVEDKTVELSWDPKVYRIDLAPTQPADGKLKLSLIPAQTSVVSAPEKPSSVAPSENPDEKIAQRALAIDTVEPIIPDSILNRLSQKVTVKVRVQVNENGVVVSARPAEYSGGLERYVAQQAADAARSVRFRPAMSSSGRTLPSAEELTVTVMPR